MKPVNAYAAQLLFSGDKGRETRVGNGANRRHGAEVIGSVESHTPSAGDEARSLHRSQGGK